MDLVEDDEGLAVKKLHAVAQLELQEKEVKVRNIIKEPAHLCRSLRKVNQYIAAILVSGKLLGQGRLANAASGARFSKSGVVGTKFSVGFRI